MENAIDLALLERFETARFRRLDSRHERPAKPAMEIASPLGPVRCSKRAEESDTEADAGITGQGEGGKAGDEAEGCHAASLF